MMKCYADACNEPAVMSVFMSGYLQCSWSANVCLKHGQDISGALKR